MQKERVFLHHLNFRHISEKVSDERKKRVKMRGNGQMERKEESKQQIRGEMSKEKRVKGGRIIDEGKRTRTGNFRG